MIFPRRGYVPVALLVAALACQGKLFSITIADEAKTTVPKGTIVETLISDFGFGEFVSMDLTEAQELKNQGVADGDIKDVRLVIFELEVASPANGDLSFLNSLELWVESPGLPAALVASQTDFPVGQGLVEFDIEDVDLTEYVISESMTFSTEVNGRRPEADTQIIARYEVDVGVTGQGACNQTKKNK